MRQTWLNKIFRSNEEKNDEEESDEEEKDVDEDDESSDDDELPQISLDLARGEAPDVNSSSSEDEEDKSEISDEENAGPDLEEGVRRVEWASTRLAICNMDWGKISAEALMIVCYFFTIKKNFFLFLKRSFNH